MNVVCTALSLLAFRKESSSVLCYDFNEFRWKDVNPRIVCNRLISTKFYSWYIAGSIAEVALIHFPAKNEWVHSSFAIEYEQPTLLHIFIWFKWVERTDAKHKNASGSVSNMLGSRLCPNLFWYQMQKSKKCPIFPFTIWIKTGTCPVNVDRELNAAKRNAKNSGKGRKVHLEMLLHPHSPGTKIQLIFFLPCIRPANRRAQKVASRKRTMASGTLAAPHEYFIQIFIFSVQFFRVVCLWLCLSCSLFGFLLLAAGHQTI